MVNLKEDIQRLLELELEESSINKNSPSKRPYKVHKALEILKSKDTTFEAAIDEAFRGVPYSEMSRSLGYCKRSNISKLLKCAIEDVPSFMGSNDPDIGVLVKWRLLIGK